MSSQLKMNLSSKPTGQRARTLRTHESFIQPKPGPSTHRTPNVWRRDTTRDRVTPTPLEEVARCKDLWFEDGDVVIWAQVQNDSMLYRVHRRVLKESGAEPFCTVVDCDYPNLETSGETFLDGVWVLKYAEQDPVDIMHVLKWMYERPSISKRSTIPFLALEVYLERSRIHFIPAMRRCVMEYLWNMLPTNLNYHQRVPALIEGCYSEHPDLIYKPHVLLTLARLSTKYQLIAILPLLYYYIAQWPIDWIAYGVPADCMGFDDTSCPDGPREPLPQEHAAIVIVGRERLIQMRGNTVFNFMEDFTECGTMVDFPTPGCDGAKRKETGETCYEWLVRVWFSMHRLGFIARPSALEIMNMGQWTELQSNCCELCGGRVIRHMLDGRDSVWKAIPNTFGYSTWDLVVERQREVEKNFEADIC